ncbi:MAG: glycosyltransferase family A protein, partial [Thermoanaerobaculia bacterium]|nr:glycosyltransferase family A protein [Thermoanaerobaculia bacterium]
MTSPARGAAVAASPARRADTEPLPWTSALWTGCDVALLRVRGHAREADRLLSASLAAQPDHPDLLRLGGDGPLAACRLEESLEHPGRALAKSADAKRSGYQIATVLAALRRDEACRRLLAPALRRAEPGAMAYGRWLLGCLEGFGSRRWDRALRVVLPGLAAEDPYPPLVGLAAVAYSRLGRAAEGRTVVERIRRDGPAGAEVAVALSRLRRDSGDGAGALAELGRLTRGYGLAELRTPDADGRLAIGRLAAKPVPAVDGGPLVSVIMTIHRWHTHSAVAIGSILAQSWRRLELIVVDDASTDATPGRLAALARRDSRLRVLRLPCNVGTYAAKNIGLGVARGELVTCMDSDDWSHPNRLEAQVKILVSRPELFATSGSYMRVSIRGEIGLHRPYRRALVTMMFRREPMLERLGAYDSVRASGDSELLWRARAAFGDAAVHESPALMLVAADDPSSLTGGGPFAIGWRGRALPRVRYRAGY